MNARLPIYGLEKTKLVIRQDTTNLKQDILNQIRNDKASVNEKDVAISKLQKEIADNTYDNKSLLGEARILFPSMTDISISNHPFNTQNEKIEVLPVAIYSSEKAFPSADVQKLTEWLAARIKKGKVYVFWKSNAQP